MRSTGKYLKEASAGMALMGILAAKMDHSSRRFNWLEQSVNLIAQLAVFLGVLLIWYASDAYPADAEAKQALEEPGQDITSSQFPKENMERVFGELTDRKIIYAAQASFQKTVPRSTTAARSRAG